MSFKPTPPFEKTEPAQEPLGGTGRALPVGTMLEEYEIQRVLSESGFAVVYLARDHAFDCMVAIKEYLPSTLVDQSGNSRAMLRGPVHATAFKRGKYAFMSESRMLASCDHPSLLRVNRIWDAHDTVYRVMPYYYGKSLQSTRQAAVQAPDEASLRSLLEGLLGALEVLHEQDCMHGAVSPENILLLADDRPVLMDFGAVRRAIVSGETQRMIAMLEPSYQALEQIEPMPPEQVPGPWSDLYSLGAVLYFCIHGELPKRSKREPIAAVVSRLQMRQPNLKYSAALLHTIEVSLSENIQDRPQSVAEFRCLLDTPRSASSVQAEPPPRVASFSLNEEAEGAAAGRVLPFSRKKKPVDEDAAMRGFASIPQASAQPSRFVDRTLNPPSSKSSWSASASSEAAAGAQAFTGMVGGGYGQRRYPSVQEMMAESDERQADAMRQERARRSFQPAPSQAPQNTRWPRVTAWAFVGLVLGGLVGAGWRVNQQMQADQVLSHSGASEAIPSSVAVAVTPPPAVLPDAPAGQADGGSPDSPPLVDMREPMVIDLPMPATSAGSTSPRDPHAVSQPLAGLATPKLPAALPLMATSSKEREPATPREACGERVDFSLYNCMQTQCSRGRWSGHLQCQRLRDTGEVIP